MSTSNNVQTTSAFPSNDSCSQFSNGVALLLHTWTALKFAVEGQWGGVDSEEKRAWLAGVVVEQFEQNGKETHADELESILLQVMSDEFNTILEDDSAYQISQDLVKLYNECLQSNYATIDALQEKFLRQRNSTRGAQIRDDDDDSSNDEEFNDEMETDENEKDGESSTQTTSKSRSPIIDDDGFQLVTRRHR
ncbi:11835_t:CDS:2 [Ambispora gerdemannii]|uniref:11835_t:CDS:1 n=1 Tax=Ambispora gerdemannii TaxID=144530 RepID=A0A9N9CKT2_9GLOM|nr:11835_t:CDS:2 [Ambispora gerdemannii]